VLSNNTLSKKLIFRLALPLTPGVFSKECGSYWEMTVVFASFFSRQLLCITINYNFKYVR
jgi:hypothetical protein